MKIRTTLALVAAAGLLSAALLSGPAAAGVRRIQVEPGLLADRLVVEADAALALRSSSYAPGTPGTLVVEIAGAPAPAAAAVVAPSGTAFVRGLRVEPAGADAFRLVVEAPERVPYRFAASPAGAVIELDKIQRGQGEYAVDAAVQRRLDGKSPAVVSLDRLDVAERDGRVRVRAGVADAVTQVFALENPSRLVVDVFDTRFAPRSAVYPVGKGGLDKVRVGQFQSAGPRPITRLVFDLREPVGYALESAGTELVVSFAAPAGTMIAAATPAPAVPVERPRPEVAAETAPVRVEPVAPPAAAPEQKAKAADAKAKADEAPAQAAPPAKTQAPVAADKFKPRTIKADESSYSGEVISLKFKDADLRDVILYLADFADLNVVFDPDVRGTVTCSLDSVPWDQAMDMALKPNKMGRIIDGNVLRIAPITTLTREDDDLRKLQSSRELAGPLLTRTYPLSYSKAKDVAALLASKKSKERGEIVIDDRTNTLILTDVKEKMDLMEKLIAVLDTPTPQVSIEARIIEATATFIRNLGVQWGARGIVDPTTGNATSIQFPNSVLVDGAMIPQGQLTKGMGGPLGGYAVNLPAPAFNSAVGFSFANVLDTFRLDVALTALETSGQGKVISSPKIVTANNQPAEIVQGRQIPVQTVANFTVTTRYINAALELHATPQITAEGTIIMTVDISNNAADFANLVNGIPPITTQSTKTTLMIPDGGTTVIGGIYRVEDSITRDRVPLLHSIPILGNLFKSFSRTKQNRELLIFLTPRIVK